MSNILSRFEKEEEVDTSLDKYLTFLIDGRYYAYPIQFVREIIEIQDITEVPEFPSYAKGIINLRDNVIPIIDVRLRFHKPEIEYSERTCIVVLTIDEVEVGFIVDTVDEVMDIDKKNISNPPSISSGGHAPYIDGIGKIGDKIIILLNAQKMLNHEDLNMFESFAKDMNHD